MTQVLLAGRAPRAAFDAFCVALADGDPCAVLDGAWPGAVRARALAVVRAAAPHLAPRDLVLFTSGASGRPRAVHRGLASWERSVAPAADVFDVGPGDVVWAPGPLASTLVLFAAWHAAAVGATPVLAGEDPAAATHVHVVPSALPAVLTRCEAGGSARLRVVVTAGDRLPGALRERAERLGLLVVEYYGAAEVSFVGVRTGPGPFAPFPGVEVDVRAERLWSRSPYQAYGYLGDEDGPLRRDGEEWACVGDLARADGPGFRVLGRAGAAVTTGGHTVVAEDVEAHLRALPGVADAAVAGVAHPRLGHRLVALVVPAGPADAGDVRDAAGADGTTPALDVAALRAASRDLPAPARPRGWAFVDAIPRTPGGKLARESVAALVRVRFPAGEDD